MEREVLCLNSTEMAEAEGIWLRGAACDAGRQARVALHHGTAAATELAPRGIVTGEGAGRAGAEEGEGFNP